MFTGIIECLGEVKNIEQEGSNKTFTISSAISASLKVDQSVAHDGVCLTVVEVGDDMHKVTAIDETLSRSSLNDWSEGTSINLERCMPANGRFDGHIVQGHVDQIGHCTHREEKDGSWLFNFEYDPARGNITVEKGSICINGVSLTCFNSEKGKFTVAIIPYTYEHTNFHDIFNGTKVNLEFDIIGKYVAKIAGAYKI